MSAAPDDSAGKIFQQFPEAPGNFKENIPLSGTASPKRLMGSDDDSFALTFFESIYYKFLLRHIQTARFLLKQSDDGGIMVKFKELIDLLLHDSGKKFQFPGNGAFGEGDAEAPAPLKIEREPGFKRWVFIKQQRLAGNGVSEIENRFSTAFPDKMPEFFQTLFIRHIVMAAVTQMEVAYNQNFHRLITSS